MPKIVGYVGEVPPAGAQPSPWLPTAAVFAGAYGMLWLASRWNNRLVANGVSEFKAPVLQKIQERTQRARSGEAREKVPEQVVKELMKLPPGVYTFDLDPDFEKREYWDKKLAPPGYRPKKWKRERWRRYKSDTTLRGAFLSASRAAEGSDSPHVLVDTRGEPSSAVEAGYLPADPVVLGIYREDGEPVFLIYADQLATTPERTKEARKTRREERAQARIDRVRKKEEKLSQQLVRAEISAEKRLERMQKAVSEALSKGVSQIETGIKSTAKTLVDQAKSDISQQREVARRERIAARRAFQAEIKKAIEAAKAAEAAAAAAAARSTAEAAKQQQEAERLARLSAAAAAVKGGKPASAKSASTPAPTPAPPTKTSRGTKVPAPAPAPEPESAKPKGRKPAPAPEPEPEPGVASTTVTPEFGSSPELKAATEDQVREAFIEVVKMIKAAKEAGMVYPANTVEAEVNKTKFTKSAAGGTVEFIVAGQRFAVPLRVVAIDELKPGAIVVARLVVEDGKARGVLFDRAATKKPTRKTSSTQSFKGEVKISNKDRKRLSGLLTAAEQALRQQGQGTSAEMSKAIRSLMQAYKEHPDVLLIQQHLTNVIREVAVLERQEAEKLAEAELAPGRIGEMARERDEREQQRKQALVTFLSELDASQVASGQRPLPKKLRVELEVSEDRAPFLVFGDGIKIQAWSRSIQSGRDGDSVDINIVRDGDKITSAWLELIPLERVLTGEERRAEAKSEKLAQIRKSNRPKEEVYKFVGISDDVRGRYATLIDAAGAAILADYNPFIAAEPRPKFGDFVLIEHVDSPKLFDVLAIDAEAAAQFDERLADPRIHKVAKDQLARANARILTPSKIATILSRAIDDAENQSAYFEKKQEASRKAAADRRVQRLRDMVNSSEILLEMYVTSDKRNLVVENVKLPFVSLVEINQLLPDTYYVIHARNIYDDKLRSVEVRPGRLRVADEDSDEATVKKNSAASRQDPALYREFRRVINMSPGEIERWRKDPRHRDASLPHIRAELPLLAQMKRTPMSKWTPKMWNKAMRAINFVKRHEAQMKVQGKRYGTGRLHSTYKRIIGLLNWGRKTPGVNIKNVLDKKTSKKSSRKTSRNISRNPSYSGSMGRVGVTAQSPTELVGRAGMIVFAKDTGRALLLWRSDGDWSLPMTRIGYGENPRSRAIQAFYLQTSCPLDVTGPSSPLHMHDVPGQALAVYVGYVPYEFMSSSPPGHLGAAWVNPYQLDQVENPSPELAHLLQVDGDRLMRMIPKG